MLLRFRPLPSSHVLVTIFLAICSTTFTSASSAQRPLKRIHHPTTLAIEIYPRTQHPSSSHHARDIAPDSTTLHHTDSFRLTLSAFDETYHLHLRPNDHLVHPSARIVYYDTNPAGQSVVSHTEPLLLSSVRAYWGEVVPARVSSERMRADVARAPHHPGDVIGWARITVHDQGDAQTGRPPVFEGAFSVRGVTHHVATRDNYFRNRGPLDPHLHSRSSAAQHTLSEADGGLVIWRDLDIMDPSEERAARRDYTREQRGSWTPDEPDPEPARCGIDALPWNSDPLSNPVLRRPPSTSSWYGPFGLSSVGSLVELLRKRDDIVGSGMNTNFANVIGQTNGCPTEQRVVYMGVAADCEYVSHYGSQANATQQILSIWNTASVLYKDNFNVSLGIVELQIQNTTCPTVADPAVPWNVNCSSPNVNLDNRLSLFSQWRGAKGNDGAGLWHMMSNCPTGSEVGIAWLGTLCQVNATNSGSSVISGTAVSTAGLTEWQVIAHEMGHNFGAIHDCADGCNNTSACCPLTTGTCNADAKFLMSPVASSGEMDFSQCSIGNICSLMRGTVENRVDTSCLSNPGRQTITLQMCGNGIVENGEDCDPGKGSNSTCCDPNTCKFRGNAVCDPSSSPCCTAQCQFSPATQVCRAAKDPNCDTAEMCTGNSSACPADVFAPNGKSCGSNGLACAAGQCTSIALQCQQLGASLGLKAACPGRNDGSCRVSCQDPTTPNQCVQLDTLLIDGSPCGYGGSCQNGTCQRGSLLDTAKAWYVANLQISIPVTVVAALFAITVLWGTISCCCNYRKRKGMRFPDYGPPMMERIPSEVGREPNSVPYSFTGPSATGGRSTGRNGRWG